jgi:voltage-gated potassium channel Kch
MFFIKTIISFLQDEEYRDLLVTTSVILIIGTISYHYIEGWSYIDSLYFSVVTLTTIGYGDFTPQTDTGKIFTVFYIIVGIGVILSFINTIQHHYIKMRYRDKKDFITSRKTETSNYKKREN